MKLKWNGGPCLTAGVCSCVWTSGGCHGAQTPREGPLDRWLFFLFLFKVTTLQCRSCPASQMRAGGSERLGKSSGLQS